jgi:hypothetical protein
MGNPSIPRVYDWLMGGGKNFAADRSFGHRVETILPDVRELAHANRQALARGVRFTVGQGVRQIIDIGAGIASIWSTHTVAHAIDPACRVLYVDNEAVAVESLVRATNADTRIGVLRADVREPQAIMDAAAGLLDLSQPVVIIMGLLLHFIPPQDDPAALLARYRGVVAPGSYLVMTHDTADGREQDMARVVALYAETNRPLIVRSRQEIADLLPGYRMVPPGIVPMTRWRPDPTDLDTGPPERSCVYMVVAMT